MALSSVAISETYDTRMRRAQKRTYARRKHQVTKLAGQLTFDFFNQRAALQCADRSHFKETVKWP